MGINFLRIIFLSWCGYRNHTHKKMLPKNNFSQVSIIFIHDEGKK